MKLSIITINYNNKAGLQKTIDSVINQTFKDFEWIIIDGGSTDGSKELIEQYSQYITYWVSEPDNGIYHAMNKGILVAKGEYLQFLNSGDILYQNDTLHQVFITDRNADVIYGDIAKSKNGQIISFLKFPNNISFKFFLSNNINHQAAFIKKATFKYSLYDINYKICADKKHFINIMLDKGYFEHIDDILVVFDITGISSIENINQEKEKILSECISPYILTDYQRLFDLEKIAENELVITTMKIFHTNKYIRFATRFIMNLFLNIYKLCQRFR